MLCNSVTSITQVDQMEIEIHDMASEQQPAATKKLKSYRSQLDTLQKEFVSYVATGY